MAPGGFALARREPASIPVAIRSRSALDPVSLAGLTETVETGPITRNPLRLLTPCLARFVLRCGAGPSRRVRGRGEARLWRSVDGFFNTAARLLAGLRGRTAGFALRSGDGWRVGGGGSHGVRARSARPPPALHRRRPAHTPKAPQCQAVPLRGKTREAPDQSPDPGLRSFTHFAQSHRASNYAAGLA